VVSREEEETEVDINQLHFDQPYIFLGCDPGGPIVVKSREMTDLDAIEWLVCAMMAFTDSAKNPKKGKREDMNMYR